MSISKLNIHLAENNQESLSFLEENEQKMSDDCMMVWKLLNQGVRLTVLLAHSQYGISSLPRRIKDLIDKNGKSEIKDVWIKNSEGKRTHKEWYLDLPSRPTKGEIVEKWNKELHSGQSVQQVALEDGTILKMGDEVETDLYPQCAGHTFIICQMTPWEHCASKVMVLAHLKGNPERKLVGFKKEGRDLGPEGIDAGHFKLVNNKK
jgi:hypothetical protein